MRQRSCLNRVMIWRMSTFSPEWTASRTSIIEMKVPVRPTPALQCTTVGRCTYSPNKPRSVDV